MKPSFLPLAFAVTLSASDALAQSMSFTLNVNAEIRTTAGQAPGAPGFFTFPFISATDEFDEPVTQQVQVLSPSSTFQGYINHPQGWTASSILSNDTDELKTELFDSGDWTLRDHTSIPDGGNLGEKVYTFSVNGTDGVLDGLTGTLINDDAHLLDPDAPLFSWNNPGGLHDAVNAYLYDLADNSQNASELLGGDASSWSPSFTLIPGHSYQLSINQRRSISDGVTVSEPAGTEPFPYSWSTAADLNSTGVYEFTAVPEPHECAALAGAGLLGFAVWRRARSRAKA